MNPVVNMFWFCLLSIQSSSNRKSPQYLCWDISALQMCMVLKGPSTECPALPSQRMSTGLKLVQWSLSLGFARTEECWDSFSPPWQSIWSWYQELWAALVSVRYKPESSVFPLSYLIPFRHIHFKLVESVSLLAIKECCLLNMYVLSLWLKKNYETKASRGWWIALWNGEKHGFQSEKASLKSSSNHWPTMWS